MKILKFPFLGLSLFFGLGILSYPIIDKTIYLWFLIFLIAIIGKFLLHYKIVLSSSPFYKLFYFLFVAISFWILGIFTTHIHSDKVQENHYSNYVTQDHKYSLEILIREELKSNSFSKKYIGEILKLDSKKMKGSLLLIVPNKDSLPDFVDGQHIMLYEKIIDFKSNLNPHQFDYKDYMSKKGVYGRVYLNKHNYLIKEVELNGRYLFASLRKKLINSFEIHNFSTNVYGIVKALLFGYRQDLSEELNYDYIQVGVVHVLAISGLHVGIIYMFLLIFLNQLRIRPKYRYIIVVFSLWFFSLLAGFSPSVVRAVCMFTLVAFSHIFRRGTSTYNTLAVSFFLMLCFNPYYIYDVGFQLSYSAVFSIVFFMPVFRNFTYSKNVIWKYIKNLIAVSLSAQIGILPLIIFYFHQIPTLFILGNLVVIPLLNIVIVLLIIQLILNLISQPLALILGEVVSFFIELMNSCVQNLAKFSHYNIQDISFSGVLVPFSIFFLLTLGVVLKKRNIRVAIIALISLFIFQAIYFYVSISEKEKKEVLLLYNNQYTNLLVKDLDRITLFSNSINILESSPIKDYCRAKYVSKKRVLPLNHTMELLGKRLLIVDSLGNYQTNLKADIVIFNNHPKINYERVIGFHKPELVLTAGSFPKWESKRLNEICIKKNIPFHSIAEKGYYKFEF